MANCFLISDTHFGHEGMLRFKRADGVTPLRPFKTLEEMDETMVSNWNKVVNINDRVYHLGDVVINRRCLAIMSRLNGRKKLIRGNHDLFKLADYTPYFDDLYGVYVLQDMILSHIPLHPECITKRFGTNVHGHLHANKVMKLPTPIFDDEEFVPVPIIDTRYMSVCVEHIDYTPISLEDLRLRIKNSYC